MSQKVSDQLKHLSFAVIIAVAICFVIVQFLAAYSDDLDQLSSIQTAKLIEDNKQIDIKLPQSWRSSSAALNAKLLLVEFDSNDFDISKEDAFLFLPFFSQRIFIDFNNRPIQAPAIERPFSNPFTYKSALIRIPPALLINGLNSIRIRVETGPYRSAYLPKIYIGSRDELIASSNFIGFLGFELRILLLGAEAILAIYSLITYFSRRRDPVYGWISLALLGLILANSSIFLDRFSSLLLFSQNSFFLLPVSGLSALGFSLTIANLRRPRWLLSAVFVVPTLSILLNLTSLVSWSTLLFSITLPVTVASLGVAGLLVVRTSIMDQSKQTNPLLISFIIVALAIIYDISVRLGVFPFSINLSPFARLIAAIGFILFLSRRTSENEEALDKAATQLQIKLTDREKTLREMFAEQQITLEKIAKSEERQRITAELHDGVAGHLVTILALVEADGVHKEDIEKTTRIALEELRTVIDMLVVSNTNLEFTLASFRERCLDPIIKAGIAVSFDIQSLENGVNLSPIEALNVFRILQEATTNSIRHGKAKKILIKAWQDENTSYISVENQGGSSLDEHVEGLGLRNMKKRATALSNGNIQLSGTPDGAIVLLSFTTNT